MRIKSLPLLWGRGDRLRWMRFPCESAHREARNPRKRVVATGSRDERVSKRIKNRSETWYAADDALTIPPFLPDGKSTSLYTREAKSHDLPLQRSGLRKGNRKGSAGGSGYQSVKRSDMRGAFDFLQLSPPGASLTHRRKLKKRPVEDLQQTEWLSPIYGTPSGSAPASRSSLRCCCP